MKGSRSTMRTLRIGKIELPPARERAGEHDLDDREARAPQPRLAKGTPWTTPVPRPLLEEEEHDILDADPDDDDGPLPPVDVEVEHGARPLTGSGARAMRSVAWSGWVEARPAGEAPRATPDAPSSQAAMRAVIAAAVAGASSRRAIAYGSGDVKQAPAVQPSPADRSNDPAETISDLAAPPASRGKGRRTSAGARALGVLLLAVAAAALAAAITTTAL